MIYSLSEMKEWSDSVYIQSGDDTSLTCIATGQATFTWDDATGAVDTQTTQTDGVYQYVI